MEYIKYLDYILTEGNKLYKTLNTFDMLSDDDLPRLLKCMPNMFKLKF